MGNFEERVLQATRAIPKGKTLTYTEIAKRAGSACAARAVGNIMKNNTDRAVPCHRVVRADGNLGGYNNLRGTSKKNLLKQEHAL